MTAMTEPIGLAEGRPFMVHDLEAMPCGRPFRVRVCPARLLDGLRPP
ncbi:MAG: hypothetical protein M3228_11120 [Actinomycetota bacterium]|nr:hypothetical protein [Actinomycetota bacterium]